MSLTFLQQVSARLREERKRLGYKSQELFADAMKMAPRTYWDKEKGNVLPDAEFLASFCELGGDTMYLLTGHRSPIGVGDKWRPYSPAEQAAAAIQQLKLTSEDGEMLIAIALRLSKP